jgi:hypothetical protein
MLADSLCIAHCAMRSAPLTSMDEEDTVPSEQGLS